MPDPKKLKGLRDRIDQLDIEIQGLISDRAQCAKDVADEKRDGADEDAHYYRPEREAQVLRGVIDRNTGPLDSEEMARLFREIMSACLALEEPLEIAFLGPEGTFTQAAALKHFGNSVNTIPISTIDEVFREVESGAAHYGVVPVENSTEGVINHTLDMFLNSPLKISGEVELRIHHHLIGMANDLSGVKRIYSHQQSLAQCRNWLDEQLPNAERISVSSNAEAVLQLKDDPGALAIAGEAAALLYDQPIYIRNIEDEPDNTTRFLIIGSATVPVSGTDKTSLLVAARNRPGALFRLLEPLTRNDISMTRIESRPSRRGMWEYVFFIDIEGHQDDDNVAMALQELTDEAAMVKILGSYPRGVL